MGKTALLRHIARSQQEHVLVPGRRCRLAAPGSPYQAEAPSGEFSYLHDHLCTHDDWLVPLCTGGYERWALPTTLAAMHSMTGKTRRGSAALPKSAT